MKLDQVIQVNLSIGMGSGGADRDDEMTVGELLAYGDHTEEEYLAADTEKQNELLHDGWKKWAWEYIDGGWSAK